MKHHHPVDLMSPKEMYEALRILGWSKAELGRRIDTHPNTITRWNDRVDPRSGKPAVPGAVAAYLRVMLQLKNVLS